MSNAPRSPRAQRAQPDHPDPLRRFRHRANILRKDLAGSDPVRRAHAAALLVALPTLPGSRSVTAVLGMTDQVQHKHLLDAAAREAQIPGVRSWADLQPRVARAPEGGRWTVRPDLPYVCVVCGHTKYALEEMVTLMREHLAGERAGTGLAEAMYRDPWHRTTMTDTDVVALFARCPGCTDGPDDRFARAEGAVPLPVGKLVGRAIPVQLAPRDLERWGDQPLPDEMLALAGDGDVLRGGSPAKLPALIEVDPYLAGPLWNMDGIVARLTIWGNARGVMTISLSLRFPLGAWDTGFEAGQFAETLLGHLTESRRPQTIAGIGTKVLPGDHTELVIDAIPSSADRAVAEALDLMDWARRAVLHISGGEP